MNEGLGIKKSYKVDVGIHNSGGRPSSLIFYKNPQFAFRAVSQNPGVRQVALRVSYKGPTDSYVCIILTHPGHASRVNYLTSEMQIIQGPDALKYRPEFACIESEIFLNEPYTVILSNYEPDMLGEYTVTFESDIPLVISEIMPEGHGLKEHEIAGSWRGMRCGGSKGSASYYQNPVFAFKLNAPTDLQARFRVVEEQADGAKVTDPTHFSYASCLIIYKLNYSFPPAPGSIILGPALGDVLVTYKGTYTNNQGALITEKKSLPAGTYLAIPSTYKPNQEGDFLIILYASTTANLSIIQYQ